ncbi:MAG: DUF3987 domain-containing protein [Prevotella sp.]|nr:DUF3987 domain-containing protein [Prevotella sp.]
MNYSCLPNEDGTLKGSKTISTTIGMDIDHIATEQMNEVKERILAKKDELRLLMLELSARGAGYHLVFRRRPELSQEENLKWASELLQVEYDAGAKDITRVFFTTTGSAEDLIFLDDEMFEISNMDRTDETDKAEKSNTNNTNRTNPLDSKNPCSEKECEQASAVSLSAFDLCAQQAGLSSSGMDVWGEHNWHTNLMAVLSVGVAKLMSRQQLRAVVAERLPNYSATEDCQKLIDYFYDKYDADKGFMNASLREINAKAQKKDDSRGQMEEVDGEDDQLSTLNSQLSARKMPQGIRDSIDAVGPQLAMPVVTAICPCIGALATGVVLDVHGRKKGLNLISYIAGDFASGKGDIDPVVDAWMSEVAALDKMYQMQEDEWRAKKRAAKNKKDQPEEPKLPVRCLTLNNTVANLAERLANTEGKHAFSFTPEADTVAQKWKSTMSDFSVMLRQSYDGTKYEREARSADAVNVHIEHLLWNVTMCGTPDALYRVVPNYTDGFQSRIAVARTPDNTFAKLEDKPYVLTPRQTERIQQVAHLLPLMQGEVVLPKLEQRGREWVERIRIETMMNDDKVRARQRIRVCVTAQRMTCCLMLCKVCEGLIQKHGMNGAEARLKQYPNLWKELLLKAQTPPMLEAYDVIADSLLENALHFFRDRIENAFNSRDYAGYMSGNRLKRGKNDSIYERLDMQFTFEQAMQHSVAIKGAGVNHNTVRQMLKNWSKQGLVVKTEDGRYRKVKSEK